MSRDLIVIIGNLRGGKDAFRSTMAACKGSGDNLLALVVPQEQSHTHHYWFRGATNSMLFTEPSDWEWTMDEYGTGWRKLSHLKSNWLGPCAGQQGSAGILLWCRRRLSDCVPAIMKKGYDRMIVTRSDQLWADYIPEDTGDGLTVPNGEWYGGITDRLHIVSAKWVPEYLSAIRDIWDRPETVMPILARHADTINIEKALFHLLWRIPLYRIPYRTVCIKEPEDNNRWWSDCLPCDRLKKVVKYSSEYKLVCENYGEDWQPIYE